MKNLNDQIWTGIAEILAGHNTGDLARSARGQALVETSLADDFAARMELNRCAEELCDISLPYLLRGAGLERYLAIREKFQKNLAKIAGGLMNG